MINELKSPKSLKKSKRIGRGYGSGVGGHTVGRGTKGQKSRSGYTRPRPGFEGGRMPLSRRIPKLKGFRRGYLKSKVNNVAVNVGRLDELFEDGDKVSFETLMEKGYTISTSKNNKIKILGQGEISKKLTVENLEVSEGARVKIEKAGGKVVEANE